MKVTRLDLDGAGSPTALVTKILAVERELTIPIPVEELAVQLDIVSIEELETEGFEGGLLTDENRRSGIILVNKDARGGRRRFTIGHELGHFLILSHVPVRPGQFLCSRRDMSRWSANEHDRYARMEYEANQFAALLLMPPPMVRAYLKSRPPDLSDIEGISTDFGVSKDAAARSYALHHNENIAVVVVKDGCIARFYPGGKFPFITVSRGKPVPAGTVFHRKSLQLRVASDVVQTLADNWINVEYGKPAHTLYEQAYLQKNGFALIMLWLEQSEQEDDDFDYDADRTAKQRLQDRQARWQR
jgi:IrrE N-terminal-like domain